MERGQPPLAADLAQPAPGGALLVKRLYAYNWTGAGCHGTAFDAGLTSPGGARRQRYFVFKRRLAGFLR